MCFATDQLVVTRAAERIGAQQISGLTRIFALQPHGGIQQMFGIDRLGEARPTDQAANISGVLAGAHRQGLQIARIVNRPAEQIGGN